MKAKHAALACMVSWFVFAASCEILGATRPLTADTAAGYVIPFKNHGIVYISHLDNAISHALFATFVALGLLTAFLAIRALVRFVRDGLNAGQPPPV